MNSQNSQPRILIIEDDEDDFFLISKYIKDIPDRKFVIDWCYQYDHALTNILNAKYDIYFVDYFLGEKSGLDLLQDAIQNNCEEPIILLTGIGNKQIDFKATKSGAVDYLVKSELNTEKLERCIRYSLERASNVKTLKANMKRMEKANLQIEKLKATSRLARTIAHEVRNPLTNINLSIEQLKIGAKEGQEKIYLDIIHRNSIRINSLISELLNSSHPGEINLQQSVLQSILNNALGAATDRVSLKQIKVVTTYPEQPVHIMADEEKLKIAFLNIIINAIEAVHAAVGELVITIIEGTEDFRVLIVDNGSGISEDNLPKIFEPYFTSKSTGFGLGLASTLSILQSHNALVDVQSKLGEGTSFGIKFNKV